MTPDIEEFKKEIVDSVHNQLCSMTNKYIKQILLRSLGVEFDTWDKVKSISPEFEKDILDRINQSYLENFKNKITNSVQDKCNNKLLNDKGLEELSNKIVEKIIENIRGDIYKTMIKEYHNIIEQKVKELVNREMNSFIINSL